jgi:8-oxo-dGTP pyrophosphatase MutT (NUDIX family)
MMMSFAYIELALAGREPELFSEHTGTHAAVALVLREGPAGLQVLFIERAPHENDPWSGNISFPGGKVEDGDGGARAAAERETMEEVGLDLSAALYLGRLSDIAGAFRPIRVSCFVYGMRRVGTLRPNDEVQDAFWVSLAELLDSSCHVEATVCFAGRTLTTPAIRLPHEGKPVLWGLTYRLVMQLLAFFRDRS